MAQEASSSLGCPQFRQRNLRLRFQNDALLYELVRLRSTGGALAVCEPLRVYVGAGRWGIVVMFFPSWLEAGKFCHLCLGEKLIGRWWFIHQ